MPRNAIYEIVSRRVVQQMVIQDRSIEDPEILKTRNKHLHQHIVRSSHNVYMIDALANLRIHLSLLPGSTYSVKGRLLQAQDEHEAIVDAVASRDGERAENAARQHVRSGYSTRLSLLAEGRD
ncbi:FCD domain-containing protein [Martelella sp. FOR1707]